MTTSVPPMPTPRPTPLPAPSVATGTDAPSAMTPRTSEPGITYVQRLAWVIATFRLDEDDAGLLLALGLSDYEIGIASAVVWLGFPPFEVARMQRQGVPAEQWIAAALAKRERIQRAVSEG